MLRLMRKGQSTAEYAIVIGLVIAAALAMQVYVKRGVHAKIKGAVDYQPDPMFTTGQYEPDYASSDMDSTSKGSEDTATAAQGKVTRAIIEADVSQRSGTQSIKALP